MAGKKATAPTIAFVTVCRGRLHHLSETLPLMAAQEPDELIVVDYACPDGAGDWAEANVSRARVVRADQPDGGFNIARARNLGAAAARSDWLFFIDADIACRPGLLEWVRANAAAGRYYRAAPAQGPLANQAFGTFACAAPDFAAVEGYDEVIEGWGYEDRDMYLRLQLNGVGEDFFPNDLTAAIWHDNEVRHTLPDLGNRWQNWAMNACYAEAKQKISLFRGGKGNLPLEERRALRRDTARLVRRWIATGAKEPLRVDLKVRRDKPQSLIGKLQVRSEWTLSVVVQAPG